MIQRTATFSTALALGALTFSVLLAVPSAASAQLMAGESDCSTPRRALATFIDNLQDDSRFPEHATRCFDWPGDLPESERVSLAEKLLRTLDQRGHFIDYDAIPDTPEVAEEALRDGRLVPVPRFVDLQLAPGPGGWMVSMDTVRRIEPLYRETFTVDVESFIESLPSWARARVAGRVELWQLIGLLLALLVGWFVRGIVSRVVSTYGVRLLKAQGESAHPELVRGAARPIGTLALTAVVWGIFPLLRFAVRVNQIGHTALRVVAASAGVLLVYRLVDLAADVFARKAEDTDTKLDDQLVPLVRKSTKVLVAVLGIIFVLQNLDIDVASLLTGVSLGGLAFTLAAKDTVANLFGSISIFADQPFQVGDWVVINGHEGIVEEVGMRSTRIRTFYNSVISVPNSIVANAAVDNYGMRKYRRCVTTLGVTYDSSPDQIQAFVEGIRAILKNNELVRQDAYEVHFRDFGASALEIMLYFFFEVSSWTDELRGRQQVFLEIMRLAKRLNVDFAFPTQTLHVETRAKETEIPVRTSAPREELASIVEGFARGGEFANPKSPELTGGYWPTAVTARSEDSVDEDAGGGE